MTRITAFDKIIGENIRMRRLACGMTLEDLAALTGFSYQQLQKYELGRSRIAASCLYRISEILGVPVAAFFASAAG